MKNIFPVILIFLILGACSTPQKSFENQDYDKAFKLALKKVKSKKATRKDRNILYESLRRILAENDRDIASFETDNNPKSWIRAIKIIDESQEKIRKAEPYVRYDYTKIKSNLSMKETSIRSTTYDFYLREGRQNLETSIRIGDKYIAQTAYEDFENAKKFTSEIRTLDSLQRICVKYGKLVYSIESDAPFGLDWEIDRAFERFENESNIFLEVYYDDFRQQSDCRIDIDFRDFNIEYDRRLVEDWKFEKEVEAGYRTEKDTSGKEIRIPIYETVFGYVKVEEFSKIAIAEVWLNVYSNSNNCQLSDKRFDTEVVNVVQRTRISGDRRAVPSDYDDNFQDELMDDDDLAEELIDQLYMDIRDYLF